MKRALRLLLLIFLTACQPKTGPAADPAWLVKAKQTGGPIVDDAVKFRKTATKVDDEDRKAIDGVLDKASGSPLGAAGLESASQMIAEGEKIGKGADAPTLEKSGGLAVLVDLVARTCAAKPNDAAVVAALDTIKISDEQKRNSLRAVGAKCGAKPKDPIGP